MPKDNSIIEDDAEDLRKSRGDFVEGEDDDAVQQMSGEEEDAPADVEEPEAETETETEAEEEVDASPGAKADDPIMIPKGRFDDALHKAREREKELQRRLDASEIRKQQESTTNNLGALETQLDELDSKYSELLLEGEVEKANEVRKQWRSKQNDLFDIRLEQRSTLASKQAIEGMRFDRQLAEYEIQHPQINPDSEEFSQEAANEVRDLMDAFEAKGWNPVAALNKAVKYALRDSESAAPKSKDPDLVRKKREAAARRKVADVAAKSPPDLANKGRDSDKGGSGDGLPDVTKMTPEQFSKLTETQLRELRGDTLTH